MSEMKMISRKEAKSMGLKFYLTGKPCKRGHVSKRRCDSGACLECKKESKIIWLEANPDYHKNYYKNNSEQINERNRIYRESNIGRERERSKSWRKRNPNYQRNYQRNRYATDHIFKLGVAMRKNLHRTLKLLNTPKEGKSHKMIGYSPMDLCLHIEKYMLEGMSWDNYGEWHIDHMYSIDRFIRDGISDPAIINALDNLRPMWAEDNLSKGNKDMETWLSENPQYRDKYGYT